jgi:hypothetical protein
VIDQASVERAAERFKVPDGALERLIRRRDRKRRNQRISAAVVGIAVFVVAVWIVTTGGPLDPTQPAVPGPTETGPTATSSVAPYAEWDGYEGGSLGHGSIPPEGVALSSPAVTEVIAHYSEFRAGFVLVYADGRVIWVADKVYERRITPEGVDLVRSGAVEASAFLGAYSQAELPASIWADPEVRLYAPPRYAVCFSRSDGFGFHQREVDPSRVVHLLPAAAQALLREEGEPRSYEALGNPPTECVELTTQEARALQAILGVAGVEQDPDDPGLWFVAAGVDGLVDIGFLPLFPDRVWHDQPA